MYPPNSKTTRLVDPVVEPLSLVDAKAFLRVETSAEDALIARLIRAARMKCEQISDRSFVTTTWQYTLDSFPYGVGALDDSRLILPHPPLIAVASANYIDIGGTVRVLAPLSYQVSTGTPGWIFPDYGSFFPFSQPRPAAVNVVYTAGYGPDPSTVPEPVGLAMMFLVAHWHRHRTSNAEVPDAVMNLLSCIDWGSYG